MKLLTFNPALFVCPLCHHALLFHDGDGWDEHLSCCVDGCACQFGWTE